MDYPNRVSYTWKVFDKLKDQTINIFNCVTHKCPFDENPQDGTLESLKDHARNKSKYGATTKIRAEHKALLHFLFKEADSVTDAVLQKEEQDLVNKVLKELQDGTIYMFDRWTFRCPFDQKPKDGTWDSLLNHARKKRLHGKTLRDSANHTALLKYLVKDVHHGDHWFFSD